MLDRKVLKLSTTVKLRATSGAAAQSASPGWLAVIVQVPSPLSVTVVPTTEHPPAALKLTARPDVAAALTVNGGLEIARSRSGANVIVWTPWLIVKLRTTSGAAFQF